MALVKYGGGITQMSGSIGGNTFARNRGGNYVRAKTIPINPNTGLQQVVRAAMAFLTERWSGTLTAAQRTAWNLYASSVAVKNRLGENVFLSGFNHYVRSNMIRKQLALTVVDAGPTTFELPEQDPTLAVTGSEGTQVLSVVYDDTLAWLDEDDAHLFLFQGSPQNAQRNFFAGPWRAGVQVDGDSVTPPTTPEAMAAVFPITELQRQWIYARIGRADGRLSEPFRADSFVAA